MTAKDIMTKDIVIIKENHTVGEVIDLLVERNISGLIVVADNGDIAGVVSEKDILIAYDFLNDRHQPIKEFISRRVVGVKPETPIKEVCKVLVQNNIKRVPVLDDKRVLGIISRGDILRYIKSHQG